jgi:hypothetical protein
LVFLVLSPFFSLVEVLLSPVVADLVEVALVSVFVELAPLSAFVAELEVLLGEGE